MIGSSIDMAVKLPSGTQCGNMPVTGTALQLNLCLISVNGVREREWWKAVADDG